MQSLGRPFIYFSEAVLTPNRAVNVIEETAKKLEGSAHLNVAKLWTATALSVRSQAQLHRIAGYKGERFHKWLTGCVETISNNFVFSDPSQAQLFRHDLVAQLYKPSTYYVPEDVKVLLSELDTHNIGWGIIANDSHLYLAILKLLNLKPSGPILQNQAPNMFKPLPQMWQRAIQKAPVANKHNLWFIGSQHNPCDNISANPHLRCALISPELASPEPLSSHFRVPRIDDLKQYLLPASELLTPDLNLDFLNEPVLETEEEDVKFTSFRPVKVPERREREQSLFKIKQK